MKTKIILGAARRQVAAPVIFVISFQPSEARAQFFEMLLAASIFTALPMQRLRMFLSVHLRPHFLQ